MDWFFTVQMLAHVPAGFFALYFVDIIGLKKSLWIGSTFGIIGTCVRIGGFLNDLFAITKIYTFASNVTIINLKSL